MSVSISEVIGAAGYNINTEEDARWLLAQVNQFEELITQAEDLIEAIEDAETERIEKNYREKFGD